MKNNCYENVYEDCKKFLRLPPYDSWTNCVAHDGIFLSSICAKYGKDVVDKTMDFVSDINKANYLTIEDVIAFGCDEFEELAKSCETLDSYQFHLTSLNMLKGIPYENFEADRMPVRHIGHMRRGACGHQCRDKGHHCGNPREADPRRGCGRKRWSE